MGGTPDTTSVSRESPLIATRLTAPPNIGRPTRRAPERGNGTASVPFDMCCVFGTILPMCPRNPQFLQASKGAIAVVFA